MWGGLGQNPAAFHLSLILLFYNYVHLLLLIFKKSLNKQAWGKRGVHSETDS